MDSIERMMKAAYPYWNCLTDEEKQIVNSIAIQIPTRLCEYKQTLGTERQEL